MYAIRSYYGPFVDHVAGSGAEDVHAQHPVGGRIHHELHGPGLLHYHGLGIARQGGLADLDLTTLPRRLLGQTHGGKLRAGVDTGGNRGRIKQLVVALSYNFV